MRRKVTLSVILILLILGGIVSYSYYQKVFGENVTKSGYLYIKSSDQINDVVKSLTDFVKDQDNFLWVAERKSFTNIKAGKYQLTEGMSNNDLVNLLRSGQQSPIKISFNNQDTLEKLAGRIAIQIEADSTEILDAIQDSLFLKKNRLTNASVLGIFIPNSYEFYWNTSGKKFRDRMLQESNRFWNTERLGKAKSLNMKPSEVITLASIVQKETAQANERPTVAGLYINRIKRGIPLQADPTIVYVLKQKNGQDFVVKRVLFKDLKIKSPYNTYQNRGLPPSLIAMPDISSIDAVLNYQKHNYIYMCASIDTIGFHTFAKTLKQHNRNAAKYQRWLNKQDTRR